MTAIYWCDDAGERLGGEKAASLGRIYDANGLEWDDVTWCNPETGELERYRSDAEGRPITNDAGDALEREMVKAASPLVIVV